MPLRSSVLRIRRRHLAEFGTPFSVAGPKCFWPLRSAQQHVAPDPLRAGTGQTAFPQSLSRLTPQNDLAIGNFDGQSRPAAVSSTIPGPALIANEALCRIRSSLVSGSRGLTNIAVAAVAHEAVVGIRPRSKDNGAARADQACGGPAGHGFGRDTTLRKGGGGDHRGCDPQRDLG